jgi:pimeloyl-ACP methyl ester carboxylesterase
VPPPVRPSQEAFEAAFAVNETTLLAGKANFNLSDAQAYAVSMLGGDGLVTSHLLQNVLRTDGRARTCMLQTALAGCGADEVDVIATSTARIALVFGAADPFIKLAYLEHLPRHNLWQKKVYTSPQWGHAPHWQPDEEFKDLVVRFYEGNR